MIQPFVVEALSRDGCGVGGFFRALFQDGRPSISPEMLLRAMLLQAFYTGGSERHLWMAPALQAHFEDLAFGRVQSSVRPVYAVG